jgi:TMEM175 potassium channel family protein
VLKTFLNRFSRGELRLGRIEAFSDGIFAVAATLLVLDLKIDHLSDPHSVRELGQTLLGQLPKFYSWLISFVIVCKFWLNHHHVLALARHATNGMVWLNSIFLMFQSLIPFPTALMGKFPENPLAVSLFGVVMAFNTLLFIALHAYILRNLLKPELVGTQDPHIIRKSFVGVFSYLAGVAAAWFNVDMAFVIYALTPLFFIVPPKDRNPH